MTCIKLNLDPCPQCASGKTDLCYIEEYRPRIKRGKIKQLLIDTHDSRVWYGEDMRCSYYLIAAVKEYYPQLLSIVEKLSVLL